MADEVIQFLNENKFEESVIGVFESKRWPEQPCVIIVFCSAETQGWVRRGGVNSLVEVERNRWPGYKA